jgi:hypothetical protein
MNTSGQSISMTDITTMDFQSDCACNECHEVLFGPFMLGEVDTMLKAYETNASYQRQIRGRRRKHS